MPLSPGTFPPTTLTDVLRSLVDARKTGCLKLRDQDHDGCLAVENGVILHARADTATGVPALFEFVGWRNAKLEFHERPLPVDLIRDLAVYEPQVLLAGIAFKIDEQNLLHHGPLP